jgi:hypothetical protein
MEQTNYRILKLKNGESLIAGLMPVTKKDMMTLENPMVFKTVSMIDEKNLGMKEFLVIRNWNEYSTDKTVDIAIDCVMAILIPDEKISSVYDFEKNKKTMSNTELEDFLKQHQDQNTQKPNGHFNTVNVELQLSPEASMNFLDLLGIELEDMEELEDMDEEDVDDEDLEDFLEEEPQISAPLPKKKNKPTENKKTTWGNSFEDWSPDPNDYLK